MHRGSFVYEGAVEDVQWTKQMGSTLSSLTLARAGNGLAPHEEAQIKKAFNIAKRKQRGSMCRLGIARL
jgi:hypothetical protein